MNTNTAQMPLEALVAELFERSTKRRGLVAAGWLLAIATHVVVVWSFASQHGASSVERTPPPVDLEFVDLPDPEPPPSVPERPPEVSRAAPATSPAVAPPAAARAGALHTAAPDATPAQRTDEAVDFTTDPDGKSYGGGVVAVSGTATFGAAGARVSPAIGNSSLVPPSPRSPADALLSAANLSRKPRLPEPDPCRGFFPSAARDDVGDVAVMVTIAKSGRVSQLQLLSENPSGQGFGGAARTCLGSKSFIPALDRDGNAAATAIRVNLRFSR